MFCISTLTLTNEQLWERDECDSMGQVHNIQIITGHTCVHGMQETLPTVTDHLWEASPSSPEPSLLCLLSVSPLVTLGVWSPSYRDIRHVTCDTHSYLDQGEIEKVMAELNRIISINDLLCSGYLMEQSLKGLCLASLMLTPFVMEVILV